MTSASSSDPSQLLCRYYASGCCRMGEQCHFSHDRSSRSDDICRYYQSGRCAYGTVCRYDHVRPKNDNGKRTTAKKGFSIPKSSQLPKPGLNIEAAEFIPSWKKNSSRRYFTYITGNDMPIYTFYFYIHLGGSYAVVAGAVESDPLNRISLCPYYEMGDCSDPNCRFIHGFTCEMNAWLSMNQRWRKLLQKQEVLISVVESVTLVFHYYNVVKFRTRCSPMYYLIYQECRQHSDFVIPSNFWVEDGIEKQTLIEAYRRNTAEKQCKYYKTGLTGEQCPFGNKCFYKHQLPDGTIDPGEAPHARRRPQLSDFLSVDESLIESDDDGSLIHRLYGVLNFMDA
uniref:RING-type E3 ubiquitin transferase n=1 Tax=Heterorhabditis bacteriophora TaxID=37862 RepID=A0A1I7WMF5_HETBA